MRFLNRIVFGFVVAAVLLVPGDLIAGKSVKVQATQKAFSESYRQGDWTRATDLGLELVQLLPDNPVAKYNLACIYALNGNRHEALHWLSRAAASGFLYLSHLDADPDLQGIRDLPGYDGVRRAIVENHLRRRSKILEAAKSSPPLIVAPENHDPNSPAPLVIALHGYGDHGENYPDLWGAAAGELGAILAVPFGARVVGDGRAWGDIDETETIVMMTLDQVGKRFQIDRERVVLTGFSQGGFMAMALGTKHPEVFSGVIPMAGGYIPDIDRPPAAHGNEPTFYFMVGSRDNHVSEVRRAAADYKEAGYEVNLRVMAGVGHSFPRDTERELGKALRFVLDRQNLSPIAR
jgi:predicted esterase